MNHPRLRITDEEKLNFWQILAKVFCLECGELVTDCLWDVRELGEYSRKECQQYLNELIVRVVKDGNEPVHLCGKTEEGSYREFVEQTKWALKLYQEDKKKENESCDR